MKKSRMHIAASVGALLISAQLCLASDARREAAENYWSAWGEKTKAELKRLPEAGRKACREALLACSLYADEYDSASHRDECKRASKNFVLEFSSRSSPINLCFSASITMTAVWSANLALEYQQGKRPDMSGGDTRYMGIDVLERAYRETRQPRP